MIRFKNGKFFSTVVISTILGHAGLGMFPFLLNPYYLKLMLLARKTKTIIFTKTNTTFRIKGNWRLFDPRTWKYIQVCGDNSLLNAFAHTNLGVYIYSLLMKLALWLGFNVVPNYYPDFTTGTAGQTIKNTLWSIGILAKHLGKKFWAVELVASCPNRKELKDTLRDRENISTVIRAVKAKYPKLIVGIKATINHSKEDLLTWEKAGADFFHCINAIPFNILWQDKTSPLQNVGGGAVSGQAIRERAFTHNSKVQQSVTVPVVFGGGIGGEADVKRYLTLRKNSSVSVCTLIKYDPKKACELVQKHNR